MPQYLVTIHRPEDYDPSAEDAAMSRAIDALNAQMVAAKVRFFVGGLQPPDTTKSVRVGADGKVVVSAGALVPAGEHVGGLWVLKCRDGEEALAWGRQAAVACRAPVEVRPFH
jgi:hypothetical protein